MDNLDQQSNEFVFKGAKLSLENAKNHFEAGEILAGKGKFGLATSHIILAAEECAKSLMLFIKYNRPDIADIDKLDFPISAEKAAEMIDKYDFQKLFSKHAPKQRLAYIISIFGQIISELSPWPISVIDDIIFKNRNFSESEKEELLKVRDKRVEKIKKWANTSETPNLKLQGNSELWKQVNSKKNDGLYVGLENNKWKSPQDFTKQDYEVAYNNVSGMIAFMDRNLELQATIDSYKEN